MARSAKTQLYDCGDRTLILRTLFCMEKKDTAGGLDYFKSCTWRGKVAPSLISIDFVVSICLSRAWFCQTPNWNLDGDTFSEKSKPKTKSGTAMIIHWFRRFFFVMEKRSTAGGLDYFKNCTWTRKVARRWESIDFVVPSFPSRAWFCQTPDWKLDDDTFFEKFGPETKN